MQSPITSFSGEFEFLSNFYPAHIQILQFSFPTVEHAYQWSKCADPVQAEIIQNAKTPGKAKRLGKTVSMVPDFEKNKLWIMEELLIQKFHNVHFANKLRSTHPCTLIEGNTWGDTYWGAVNLGTENTPRWVGINHLGIILMNIRSRI